MNIAVIGLGLIGGSALLALAEAHHDVIGYDADPPTREAALAASGTAPRDARWRVAHSVAEAVGRADLVLLAVPLPAVGPILDLLTDAGYSGLVSDTTSVKQPVRHLARRRLAPGETAFVGGHPMTGRELSGFAAADPNLFTGCCWVLCLDPETPLDQWFTLAETVIGLGARIVPATSAEHDRAVAVVSHVPHLVATAIAASAGLDPLALSLAAGSFRDGTRVAATRPDLVAAMCGGNSDAVRHALDEVCGCLAKARAALDGPDPVTELVPWLARGQRVRARWQLPASDQSPPAVTLPGTPEALLALGRAGGWVTRVAADRRSVTAVRPDPA
ncbi:MAG: prephenate dehydrogenase/arogenate dehydrogenase family protein [Dactylosporangium sp.]|nr:prephenate dehydrogenase/arogenate dehydrogenase family protein [Dactylosporangium sp.]NNJ61661.1 prephenate dehydrogenase/arogenate dehydrogenase family protein [Dactylosporangium sp.]